MLKEKHALIHAAILVALAILVYHYVFSGRA